MARIRDQLTDELMDPRRGGYDPTLRPPVTEGVDWNQRIVNPPGTSTKFGLVPTDPNAPGSPGVPRPGVLDDWGTVSRTDPDWWRAGGGRLRDGGGGPPAALGQAPAGFDPTKWADLQHQTPKYFVGRALAQNPENIQGAMDIIRQRFPGAEFRGKDRLYIPGGIEGVNEFDVLGARSTGAWNPAWQPITGEAPTAGAIGGGGGVPGGVLRDFGPMTSGSQQLTGNLSQLIAQLLGGGSLENEFLKEQLRGRGNQ